VYTVRVTINPPTVEVIGPGGSVCDFRKFGHNSSPNDMAISVTRFCHQYLTKKVVYADEYGAVAGDEEC